MIVVTMEDDVWQALQHRAKDDATLRGLLKLVEATTATPLTAKSPLIHPNAETLANGQNKRPQWQDQPAITGINPRQEGIRLGRVVRHDFATKHEMRTKGGIIYERKGVEIIMPFATERNPGHWFLGAPVAAFKNGQTQFLVLLCWKDDAVLDFVIPPQEVADLTRLLTSNQGGQYIFNVARRNSTHYELLVPGCPKDITKYLHADNLLSENS